MSSDLGLEVLTPLWFALLLRGRTSKFRCAYGRWLKVFFRMNAFHSSSFSLIVNGFLQNDIISWETHCRVQARDWAVLICSGTTSKGVHCIGSVNLQWHCSDQLESWTVEFPMSVSVSLSLSLSEKINCSRFAFILHSVSSLENCSIRSIMKSYSRLQTEVLTAKPQSPFFPSAVACYALVYTPLVGLLQISDWRHLRPPQAPSLALWRAWSQDLLSCETLLLHLQLLSSLLHQHHLPAATNRIQCLLMYQSLSQVICSLSTVQSLRCICSKSQSSQPHSYCDSTLLQVRQNCSFN